MNIDLWEWLLKRLFGKAYVHWGGKHWEVDLSSINRLYVGVYGTEKSAGDHYELDTNKAHIAISWGNGNSDPVWGVYFDMWVPKLIGSRLWL